MGEQICGFEALSASVRPSVSAQHKRNQLVHHALPPAGPKGVTRKSVGRAIFTGIVAFQFGNTVLAQEVEPTLEETVDYLNSKLALCPPGFAQEITLEDGNSMHVTGHSVGRPGRYRTLIDEIERRHEVRFSLADLRLNLSVETLEEDGHMIGEEIFDVTVVSALCAQVGCIDVIGRTLQDGISDGTTFLSERFLYDRDAATQYHFFVCDDDEAERFESALMHALELGDAQKELF